MSFGFSIGDFLQVTQLARNLYSRIRSADALFREFSADLELADTIFGQLRDNWELYNGRLETAHPQANTQAILRRTIIGIRDSLRTLSDHLQQYGNVGQGLRHARANLAFTRELAHSRQRLQMHLSSLSLVVQSLQLTQAQRTHEVLERIEAAQQEEEEEGVEHSLNEELANFEAQHVRRTPPRTVATSVTTTTSIVSRDILINRWRQHLQTNLTSQAPTIAAQDEQQAETVPPDFEDEQRLPANPWGRFPGPDPVEPGPITEICYWVMTAVFDACSLILILLSVVSLSISIRCTGYAS